MSMANKLTDFKFVQNVPKDTVVIPAFLGGEWGRLVHNEVVGKYGTDNSLVTKNVRFSDDVVKGSKPGYVIAVNNVLQQAGLRTATPADLEEVLREERLKLRGQYEDTALVLRNTNEPNAYLAGKLMTEVKSRLGKDIKNPIMIPLNGLDLVEDKDSDYGLSFTLKEDAELISAPELVNTNDYKKFSKTNEKGLPIFDTNGNRTLYTRDSGLSRLYLNYDLDLGSDDSGLGDSDDDGRVVVVSGEATSQKNKGESN